MVYKAWERKVLDSSSPISTAEVRSTPGSYPNFIVTLSWPSMQQIHYFLSWASLRLMKNTSSHVKYNAPLAFWQSWVVGGKAGYNMFPHRPQSFLPLCPPRQKGRMLQRWAGERFIGGQCISLTWEEKWHLCVSDLSCKHWFTRCTHGTKWMWLMGKVLFSKESKS